MVDFAYFKTMMDNRETVYVMVVIYTDVPCRFYICYFAYKNTNDMVQKTQ